MGELIFSNFRFRLGFLFDTTNYRNQKKKKERKNLYKLLILVPRFNASFVQSDFQITNAHSHTNVFNSKTKFNRWFFTFYERTIRSCILIDRLHFDRLKQLWITMGWTEGDNYLLPREYTQQELTKNDSIFQALIEEIELRYRTTNWIRTYKTISVLSSLVRLGHSQIITEWEHKHYTLTTNTSFIHFCLIKIKSINLTRF